MLHKNRRWAVGPAESAEDLARILTEHDWTTCTGWRLGRYLFLNDSTSADGAQEYAIVRADTGAQIESITFSWCTYERALFLIREILAGMYDGEAFGEVDWRTRIDAAHTPCAACM